MDVRLDLEENAGRGVTPAQMGTYVAFRLTVDAAGRRDGDAVVAICEPAGVTAGTIASLDVLKDAARTQTIVVHSRFAGAGDVPSRFPKQLADRTFRLMSVVPPPFDDVFEYHIWMFELTFREATA